MAQEFPVEQYLQIRFLIEDVRDKERWACAFKGINFVIHAAAIKHVHLAKYSADECIKTNVGGVQNIVHASLETEEETVVAL